MLILKKKYWGSTPGRGTKSHKLHSATNRKERKQKITSVDKDIEKLKTSYMVGGIVEWCSSSGKQFGSSPIS